jgi:hypothetical protein
MTSSSIILALFLSAIVLLSSPATADGSLSISVKDGYDQMRSCVSEVFKNWDRGGLWNGALQCDKNDDGYYLDACVCRCDLRVIGESYISSFAYSACSYNTIDVQSGLLMYDDYCATALPGTCPGYSPAHVQVVLPTTSPAVLSI